MDKEKIREKIEEVRKETLAVPLKFSQEHLAVIVMGMVEGVGDVIHTGKKLFGEEFKSDMVELLKARIYAREVEEKDEV